jgi:beta-barrel assembly-enhancing protease
MSRKAIILAAILTVSALARDPGEPIRPGMNLFSKQQDVQLGQEAAQQVRQKYREVDSPFLKGYVRDIGTRLASAPAARETGFPFSFSVLQDKSVNAFALPGGPMFIFSGLVRNVDNEAQLAAVMAHEMAHVILRHGTHQVTKANLIKLPVLLAGEALGQQSLLATITNLGANAVILRYSRDAESDADALGAHLMAQAGYDPVQMARFFNKLQSMSGRSNSSVSQFFSDHPNPGNRERAIMAEAQTIRAGRYGFESGQFQRAQSEAGGSAR